MSWVIIKNFLEQYKALKDCKSSDKFMILKIKKNIHSLSLAQIIQHLHQSEIQSKLTYLIRENMVVVVVVSPLALSEPHPEIHVSVKDDQAQHLSHIHALYKKDFGIVNFVKGMVAMVPSKQSRISMLGFAFEMTLKLRECGHNLSQFL